MNSKIIIGIVIVAIVIAGGFFLLNKNKTASTTMQNMPTQSQGQSANPTGSDQKPTTTDAVTIENYAFSPATITVKVGDTVTWTNKDSMEHSATADDNSFDTGLFSQGQSKSITFKKAGTFTYHCSAHPYMKGTVIVQ